MFFNTQSLRQGGKPRTKYLNVKKLSNTSQISEARCSYESTENKIILTIVKMRPEFGTYSERGESGLHDGIICYSKSTILMKLWEIKVGVQIFSLETRFFVCQHYEKNSGNPGRD